MTLRPLLALALLLALGCASRPPCADEDDGASRPAGASEPSSAKLVHLVTFEMGPFVETLTGYLVVRAPDRLRLYGMTETGQRAFDLAWRGPPTNEGAVVRLYRAPFLKDDRVLDEIARAAARVFLLRPERAGEGEVEHHGVLFASRRGLLRWFRSDHDWACFSEWTADGGVLVPRRVRYRSDAGPHPYELRMKLLEAKALARPPADELFAPK